MPKIHRRKICVYITLTVSGLLLMLNVAIFWRESYRTPALSSLEDARVYFNESGEIDTTSRWRNLSLTTYVFTSYLDDRKNFSVMLTVLGIGQETESPISGTLLLHNGVKISLGEYEERKKLNPSAFYIKKRLGPFAYSWPLPNNVTANSLRSIVVQQRHNMTGTTEAEIPITIPAISTKTFGVCIDSPIFGHVNVQDVVETIEINKVLGAEWFTFYMFHLDKELQKVLREYANEEGVEVIENFGKGFPSNAGHYGQTLSINECVYRNIHRVKYLVYTDLDEFIVPKTSLRWGDMMEKIESSQYGTYIFRNAFFVNNDTIRALKTIERATYFTCNETHHVKFPRFLTHITRSNKIYDQHRRSKYIVKPLCVSIVGVHRIFKHSEDHIKTYVVSPRDALLHHVRHPVLSSVLKELQRHEYTSDKRALVYKEKLVAALRRRLCRLYASAV